MQLFGRTFFEKPREIVEKPRKIIEQPRKIIEKPPGELHYFCRAL